MPILTNKHCRVLPAAEDGSRVLVMRYWPRGVKRDQFHIWLRQLEHFPIMLVHSR
jgi:uncharacterized protein YeaO (DUF488 family)